MLAELRLLALWGLGLVSPTLAPGRIRGLLTTVVTNVMITSWTDGLAKEKKKNHIPFALSFHRSHKIPISNPLQGRNDQLAYNLKPLVPLFEKHCTPSVPDVVNAWATMIVNSPRLTPARLEGIGPDLSI
ncbi:hypothetical protein EVAR_59414_1 [Eumeta japonica]|uniref:Uncharacterized protein n=1 Tax=Eumeta variegata TaxID=151549 RepID=A0A4C1Z2F7_EUMVA|nr:hypothetical protein EVAR_59414_1 [Eumeta japonica]